MNTIKICPKCLFIPRLSQGQGYYACPYCKTRFNEESIPSNKVQAEKRIELIVRKYKEWPEYDAAQEAMSHQLHIEHLKQVFKNKNLPALVKCPFCGGDITTVHDICPHCNRNVEGKLEHPAPTPTLTTCPVCQGKLSTAATACPHCGQPMNQGKPVQAVQQTPAQPKREENIPRCPTCNSTNIRKLDVIDRGLSFAVWGIFSSKIGKSMMCKDCGYKW